MRANQDPLVGPLAASNLSYYVVDCGLSRGFVLNRQLYGDRPALQFALDELGIFHADLGYRQRKQLRSPYTVVRIQYVTLLAIRREHRARPLSEIWATLPPASPATSHSHRH